MWSLPPLLSSCWNEKQDDLQETSEVLTITTTTSTSVAGTSTLHLTFLYIRVIFGQYKLYIYVILYVLLKREGICQFC